MDSTPPPTFTPAATARLSGLSPVKRVARSAAGQDDDFKFSIEIVASDDGASHDAFLTITKEGAVVTPDRQRVTAAAGRVLDALADVRARSGFQLGWDGIDNATSLGRYPMVAALLMDCHNVEVKGVGPVTASLDAARATVALTRVVTDDGATLRYEPTLGVAVDGGASEGGAELHPIEPQALIARRTVLDGATLREVPDMGENFSFMPLFISRIAPESLKQWLSLFFTFIDNVEVVLDGKPVEWRAHEASYEPTIIFTRVDADRSLNMEVACLLPGIDYGLQGRIPFTAVAIDGPDGRPAICRVASGAAADVEAYADKVDALLSQYAPSRADYKNVYRTDGFFIVPPEVAGPFLLSGLPTLLRDFALLGSDNLREYKIQPAFPKIKMRLPSSGINFLEADTDVSLGGEAISLSDLLTQYRRQKFVLLSDGNRAILDDRYMRRLQRIFRVEGSGKSARVMVSYFDMPEIEALLNGAVEGAAPKQYRAFYEGFNALAGSELPLPDLHATLRPYQLEGVKWMNYLRANNMEGCLADDMGLGKTVQTIAMLSLVYGPSVAKPGGAEGSDGSDQSDGSDGSDKSDRSDQSGGPGGPEKKRKRGRPRKSAKAEDAAAQAAVAEAVAEAVEVVAAAPAEGPLPSLLVMPKSLIFNWESEIARFAPWLRTYTYYASTRDIEQARRAQVVITTYGMMRNDIDTLRRHRWEYVVLDESQNIKNMESLTAKSAFLLQSNHRLALSGTPMENNILELYSLFRFLNPGMLGDVADFTARYAAPIQGNADAEAMAALRRKIFPFMLRRLKRDVLTELPDLTEQVLYTEMEPAHARLYEERRRYYQEMINATIAADGVSRSQFIIFQALSELRRIASVPGSMTDGAIASPKLEPLIETIVEATANGHKCVVFFNFIAGIETVGERLDGLGIDYATMTGSTGDRRSVVQRFQTDPECRVLLLTLKVGGLGLNLTAADTVFIYEPWWNRAAEKQAIDRLHRIGQRMKVTSFSMIVRGTIEERIRQLQDQKAALFDGLVAADATLSKQITQEDIDFIFS